MKTLLRYILPLLLIITSCKDAGEGRDVCYEPEVLALAHTGSQFDGDASRHFEMYVRLDPETGTGYVRCGKAPLSMGVFDHVDVSWDFDSASWSYMLRSEDGRDLVFTITGDEFGSALSEMSWSGSTGEVWNTYAAACGWQTAMPVQYVTITAANAGEFPF